MVCESCDLKRHRRCTCGRVEQDRQTRGGACAFHVGRRKLGVRLRVGTECSGIEAPIVALRRMGVPHNHVYSTEINASARVWSAHNCSCAAHFDDITTRDAAALSPVDLYVCGFPCQPFSSLNRNKHADDPRKDVLAHVTDAIRATLPTTFVLENVPRFATHEGGVALERLTAAFAAEYDVAHRVLNALDYGVPQNRRRLYVVGIRKDAARRPFAWPERRMLSRSCIDLLDTGVDAERWRVRDKYYGQKLREWEMGTEARMVNLATYALNPDMNRTCDGHKVAPCLTTMHPGLYAPHMERMVTVKEYLRLQGFTGTIVPPSLTHAVVKRLVGNSMTVDVLIHIFHALLGAIGHDLGDLEYADVV